MMMMHCNTANTSKYSRRSAEASRSGHEQRMMKKSSVFQTHNDHHQDLAFSMSPLNGENTMTALTIPKTQHHVLGGGFGVGGGVSSGMSERGNIFKAPSIKDEMTLSSTLRQEQDCSSFFPLGNTPTVPPPNTTSCEDIPYPSPISQHEHVTVVKEIKLESWWTNHKDDGFSAEFLKKLLLDQQPDEKVPEESSSIIFPIQKSDLATGRSPRSQDTADNSSATDNEDEDDDDESNSSSNSGGEAMDRVEKWNQRFHELLKFRDERGHTLVPHNFKENPFLAQWVKRQRYQFKLKCEGKHSTLSDDRMNILKTVGFIWSRHTASWEERYTELAEFAKLHGHCNVPSKFPENHQLSVWVRCQRRQYRLGQRNKPSTMTPERIARLNQLEFSFNPRNMKHKK